MNILFCDISFGFNIKITPSNGKEPKTYLMEFYKDGVKIGIQVTKKELERMGEFMRGVD